MGHSNSVFYYLCYESCDVSLSQGQAMLQKEKTIITQWRVQLLSNIPKFGKFSFILRLLAGAMLLHCIFTKLDWDFIAPHCWHTEKEKYTILRTDEKALKAEKRKIRNTFCSQTKSAIVTFVSDSHLYILLLGKIHTFLELTI